MPRYFFHIHDGIIDDVGTEFVGVEEAHAQAVVLSGEMLKEAGPNVWNNGEWRLHVTNEAGATVCDLRFSSASQVKGGRKRRRRGMPNPEPLPA